MAQSTPTTRFRLWLWLIRAIGVIVPRRLRADWRQEWEAELRHREALLAEWDRLDWRNKLDLLWRSTSAFWDALWLQPKRWEDEMIQDLRFGIKMLCKNPGFSVVVLLSLAFGIGVNTALFTVFNALVLKPLPLKDADSFVIVLGVAQPGQRARRFSFPDYQDYAARNQSFSGLTLMSEVNPTLGIEHSQSRDGQAQREEFGVVNCQLVAANYFSVLGAEMVLGRGFLPEEESTPNTHPVAVLSHYFWERSLNRDPQVIGRTIRLAGQLFTIVGVTNQEFIGTEFIRPVCWLPLMMREAFSPTEAGANWTTDRTLTGFNMFGRLKPGVAVAQAQAELSHLTAQLAQEHPNKRADEPRNAAVQLTRAPSFTANDNDGDAGQLFLVLPLSVALVLLIACANVANLMLARAAKRQKEIATRLALGATRSRIVRQLLTESVLIALAGGALGLLLAWWSLRVLYPLLLASLPLPATFRASLALNLSPDYRVFGFALLMALLAGVTAGLAPAWQASRPDLTSALKGEGSVFGEHLSQSRLRNALIVTQLAFSLVLLVSAGLLVRNLQKLQTVDTGYETARLFTIEADLGLPRAAQTEALRQQLETRLRALPDVQSVSRTSHAPLEGGAARTFVTFWSPPAFMKDNNDILHGGRLKPEYYEPWANYYTKFIKAYEGAGIPIWGISIQNEPMATQKWESCIYSAEEERDFLRDHLGPTMKRAGLGDKKIIAWDHNRDLIYQRASTILSDRKAAQFVWGIGYHWYEPWSGGEPMFDNVRLVYETFPDKHLIFTEGCVDSFKPERINEWKFGEQYGRSMINDFNNGTVGWCDWNILLDERGGPNHVENFCFAPVHANTKTGELTYLSSFYYIGHFSKFIQPGARRIASSPSRSQLLSTAFINPDGKVTVVVMNSSDKSTSYWLWLNGNAAEVSSLPHSIQTLVF